MEIKTEEELHKKLDALGDMSDEQRNRVTCSLLGHSKIQSVCFGYWNCARCGEQLGDSLGGTYEGRDKVIVGHKCEVCTKNYENLGWEHKVFVADPFEEAA